MPIFQMSMEAWRDSITCSYKVVQLQVAHDVSQLEASAPSVTSQLMGEWLG